ncbi:MAG: glycosyltransferase [Bacteroidia bacterium]|nr:glycosyltransferase [Bacteroidia bacterium]
MNNGSAISVVIPFLNEEENIPELVRQIDELAREYAQISFEFVFVDDGSTDNSLALLKNSLPPDLVWKVVKLSRNYGSYNALRVGVFHSSCDIVTFLYADLQDPTWLIPRMFEKMKEGYDIVVAERKTTKYRFSDRFFSELHARMIRKFVAETFPEKGFDVVMFTRAIKEKLNENIEADSNIFMQILRSGYRQGKIQYDKVERKFGVSKWSFSNKIKASLDILVSFSYLPVRIISLVGLLLTGLGLLWPVVFTILWLAGIRLEIFPSTIIAILLLGFGFTNISLAILGEYLWRILNAARRRPAFTVDEVIEKK